MHLPEARPRPSIFYRYRIHPFLRPAELRGGEGAPRHRVAVVGGGPIGLLTALDLARYGIPSVVLQQELQVSHGSRAAVLTRRSMDILHQKGLAAPFVAKGLPWSSGRSFFRGQEVYRMLLPQDPGDRFAPATNVQQQYIEEFLVDAIARTPLVELRWGSTLVGIEQDAAGARLRVDTPEGEYDLHSDWVVAADGGRSALRRMLGLRMEGRAYAGNFVIADIRAEIPLPTQRLCYFEPHWNPGNNVLVHRMPDRIWRLDYRLPEDETPEQALQPVLLARRIELVLEMLGHPLPWELDWATVYSASTLTLPDYLHGRVIFAGDAAHLLPIFGVRGANTGIQDSDNLGWKLAAVIHGWAGRALLESYSRERVAAAREICEEAGKSTRFMSPPSRGFRLMRDAALSFTLSEEFTKELLNWRTSRPHAYLNSTLNSPDRDDSPGPACGETAPNLRLAEDDFLLDRLAPGFTLLLFAGGAEDDALRRAAAAAYPVPVACLTIGAGGIPDPEGRVAARYGAAPGAAVLLRPDGHVCARWRRPGADDLRRALRRALALPEEAIA